MCRELRQQLLMNLHQTVKLTLRHTPRVLAFPAPKSNWSNAKAKPTLVQGYSVEVLALAESDGDEEMPVSLRHPKRGVRNGAVGPAHGERVCA